jgi:hypothetical protein
MVFLFSAGICTADNKIPFCKSLTVAPEANEVLVTVQEDQQFILLKLYADGSANQNWHLDVDNQVLLAGTISIEKLTDGHLYKTYVHDFPDSCVVVPAGKTLTAVNKNAAGWKLTLTVIGYFAQMDSGLISDLNGDNKVNLEDFALLANEWLADYS